MASDPYLKPYRTSMLDRLLDAREAGSMQTLLQLEQSILRDVQDLLNTCRPPQGQFASLPDANKSVANYGIMDFAHLELMSPAGRNEVLDHIKEVIKTFEPRLTNVEVAERNPADVEKMAKKDYHKGAVYLQIKATLIGNPGPDVSFETILELASGAHTVKKDLS